ncbi:hypothetical protein MMC22_009438 [Lobaria immixta]|nr:hypothetical protein [Lobaria immixta]
MSIPDDIQVICSDNVLSISLENDYLHFELIRSFKAQIRRAFDDGEWLRYRSQLVPLVVLAFPDLYAEPLWHVIKSGLGDLIQSTIFPFLSTIEWQEMMVFETIFTELLLFLAQYSISQGIHTGTGLPFKVGVLAKLQGHYRDDLGIIESCVLKDRVRRSLLDSVTDDRSCIVLQSHSCQRLQGFLGFAIDFLARSTYSFELSNKLLRLGIRWLPNRANGLSTITGVAGLLVSSSTTLNQGTLFGLFNYDHHIKAALGFELNQRNHQMTAKLLLATSLESIEDEYTGRSLEYGLFSAEFVKCCLTLEHWMDGELWASRAILHLAREDLGHRLDTMYLKTGLSHLLMRQDKFDEAEIVLADLTSATISCPYLTTVIALSASEVWRRLDKIDALNLGKHSPLWKVLDRFDDVELSLKIKFLEELSATIIRLNGCNSINFQETRSIVSATIHSFSKNWLLKSNVRFASFKKEFSIFASEDSISESAQDR